MNAPSFHSIWSTFQGRLKELFHLFNSLGILTGGEAELPINRLEKLP